jgi:MYXO-CTERM domain-containing protein
VGRARAGQRRHARGTAIAQEIYAGLLRGGPTIPESYGEALVADDDDGDLGNGTPHGCEISAAFALHGLGEGAGGTSSVVATHEGKDVVAADEKWTVVFELPPPSDCFSGVADEAVVHYRRGEADWKDLQARVDGGTVRATMPAFPDGTFVEYWMEGFDVDGNGFSSPSSQRVAAFTTYVGDVLQVACDKLGAEDGGYKGKVLEGTAQDPWQFGAPRGEGGDPARPWSGNNVWGTTLEDDGLYPSNSDMRLRTPPIPTKHYTDVFLQYRRWIGVEDTAFDQAGIEVNGQRVWKNSGTSTQTGDTFDDQWVSHSVDLRGVADMGQAVIDYTLQSDDGVEYGGWNIDDVCLFAPNTADNRLGVGDLRVVEDVDGVLALTWTHPAHEPADRVVLVKRSDRFPESADDGFVVADLSDFELGSVGTAVDLFPEADNYYAIYGSDGTEWSSFTVEGVNAVHHERSGTDGLFGFVRQEATGGVGCGCDAAGSGAGAVGALVAAALVARRRRR